MNILPNEALAPRDRVFVLLLAWHTPCISSIGPWWLNSLIIVRSLVGMESGHSMHIIYWVLVVQ